MTMEQQATQREDEALFERHIASDPAGRGVAHAHLAEYGTPVWALVAYYLGEASADVARVAADYELPVEAVHAALAYYRRYKAFIDAKLLLNAA